MILSMWFAFYFTFIKEYRQSLVLEKNGLKAVLSFYGKIRKHLIYFDIPLQHNVVACLNIGRLGFRVYFIVIEFIYIKRKGPSGCFAKLLCSHPTYTVFSEGLYTERTEIYFHIFKLKRLK